MSFFSVLRLGLRQALSAKGLTALLGLGVFAAATLLASAPIYARAMADLGLTFTVRDELRTQSGTQVVVESVPIAADRGVQLRNALETRIDERIGWFRASQSRFIQLGRFGIAAPGDPPKTGLFQAQPQSLTGYESHIRVVSGALPGPSAPGEPLQLAISSQEATTARLKAGDVIELRENFDTCERILPATDPPPPPVPCDPTATASFAFPARITAVIEPLDVNDPFWVRTASSYFAPFRLQISDVGPILPMFADERALLDGFGAAHPEYRAGLAWNVIADPERLNRENFQLAKHDLDALYTDAQQVGGWSYGPLGGVLTKFGRSADYQEVPLTLLLLEITAIALFYVGLVATIVVERQTDAIILFRSRGASMGQVAALALGQGLSLGLPAIALAPFIAAATTALLGLTPAFHDVSGGDLLPVTIPAISFAAAAVGAGLSIVTLVVPALLVARRTVASQRRMEARPAASVIHRYYLDLAFVAVAGVVLYEVRQRSSVFEPSSTGGLGSDPLLLASPALIIGAASALVLRFYPLVLRLVSKLALPAAGLSLALALVQVVRNSRQYTRLTLLLLMAVAVGAFAASYASTTNRSYRDRASYDAGADLWLPAPPVTPVASAARAFDDRLSGVDGVKKATTVIRINGGVAAIGGNSKPFQMLGVDPGAMADILWWRDDFADQDLPTLLGALSSSDVTPGRPLAGTPATISAWVRGDPDDKVMTLWVRFRDATGRYDVAELGSADTGSTWRQLTADIASRSVVAPISIVSISITMPANLRSSAYPALLVDDIVMTTTDGKAVPIDDFESGIRWGALPIRAREQDSVSVVKDGAHGGQSAAKFTFAPGTVNDTRGMFTTSQSLPLDAVVSDSFLGATGARIGSNVMMYVGRGTLVPITVRGSYHLFPTLPTGLGPSVIVNRNQFQAWAETAGFNDLFDIVPNEVMVSLKSPVDSEAVSKALVAQADPAHGMPTVVSKEEQLDHNRRNPLIAAGGSGILFVAFAAILGLVAAALLLSLLTSVARRRVELAVVRALGVSRMQVLRMLILEYVTVAVIGTVVGSVLGVVVGRQMLGFLDVTETGARVEPAFILQTRWDIVAAGVGAVFFMFAAGLALATRVVSRTGADTLRTE